MNTVSCETDQNIPLQKQNAILMNEEGLLSFLFAQPEAKYLHKSTVKWIVFYIVKKWFLKPKLLPEQLLYLRSFMLKLSEIIGSARIYWWNTLRYMSDKTDMVEVCEDILLNTQYWVNSFGIDFFKCAEKKERLYFLRSQIDKDFYIACKGGSGISTFCIDISIGYAEQSFPWIIRNEIWKMSIDTDSFWMRIVRTGWSMNSSHINAEERSDKFDQFKSRYKILPQRALGALAHFIAESESKYPLRAITLEWAKKKNMSLVSSSKVSFDYTKLFTQLWLKTTGNENWLSSENFTDGISTLQAHETWIVNKIFEAFNKMTPTCSEGVHWLQLSVVHRTQDLMEELYLKFRDQKNSKVKHGESNE